MSGQPGALVAQAYQKFIFRKDLETIEENTQSKGTRLEDHRVPKRVLVSREEGSVSSVSVSGVPT